MKNIKRVLALTLTLCIILSLAACGGKPVDNDVDVSRPDTSITDPASSAPVDATVRDDAEQPTESRDNVAKINGVTAWLSEVVETRGDGTMTASEGNVYLVAELTITNDSENTIKVDGLTECDAYADSVQVDYSLGAMMSRPDDARLEGTLEPGQTMSGSIGFEIPDDWSEFELNFSPSFWDGQVATFTLDKVKS